MGPVLNLVLFKEDQILERFTFPADISFVLTIGNGRSNEVTDLVIPSPIVSRQHACIDCDGKGNLYLLDLGSSNGTYLNQECIPPHQKIPLGTNASITFSGDGEYRLSVEVDFAEKAPDQPVSSSQVNTGQKSILEILQIKDNAVIGRSPECDIVISDDTVSRRHFRVEKTSEGTFRITDLASTNGTFVNGSRIEGTLEIGPDDPILVGDFLITLKGILQDIRQEVAIRAERITKRYSNGYLGLQETSISIPARSLLAIMGPSGCGKSTLMKSLNGDDPASNGRVYIHGLELASNYEYLKPKIGYVPQDDIVHKEITVEKSLYYAAKLRMEHTSNEQIKAKIDQILVDLNIEHIRHSKVGKISGGQRKRVSIAVELLTDPLILFLDEPTSPLDPQTIEEFLDILRTLSEKGTTVIMVTHKPEDLNYMDSVIFMAKGGALVFYGPTDQYQGYFDVSNTVEVYAALSGEQAVEWIERYQLQSEHAVVHPAIASSKPSKLKTSLISQFYWLTRRNLNIKINDRVNTLILLAQAPVIAILLSIIFQQVVPAVPFLISVSAIWFGVSNAAREIVGELPIYRRERMFNLRIAPYIFSKLVTLTLFGAIQSVLFIGILYLRFSNTWFEGIHPVLNNPVATMAWMLFLSSAATLMGLLLSAAVNTTEKVMTLVPIILIPQIILAGFIARITNWGVEIISWLTLARWGTEGFHIVQSKVYLEQTLVNSVANASGKVISRKISTQGVSADAVTILKASFLKDYSNGKLFGAWTSTIALDAAFIAGLGLLFFLLTWLFMKRKDSL